MATDDHQEAEAGQSGHDPARQSALRGRPGPAYAYMETTQRVARCEVRTLDDKLQCGRPAAHAGPHIHVATNGTTSWGGTT